LGTNLALEEAGATIPIRDKIDKRIVNEVKNGTGKIVDSPIEVGGYPIYKSGIPFSPILSCARSFNFFNM